MSDQDYLYGLNDGRAQAEGLAEALEVISASTFGLQGIQEDYGNDTNAYNYQAMKYWMHMHEVKRVIARTALAKYREGE